MPSRPSIVILDANDVVLAEIAAGLDLDQLEQDLAGIFQPISSFHEFAPLLESVASAVCQNGAGRFDVNDDTELDLQDRMTTSLAAPKPYHLGSPGIPSQRG
jgi:hypothetical protein